MTMISIGANIKSRRRALGLTQAELAKQLGLTQANVSRIEANVKGPSADLLLSGAALVTSSALARFGLFQAGKDSVKDPKYTVEPQRNRLAKRRAAGIVDDSITTAG